MKAVGLSFYTLPEDPIIVQTGGLPNRPLFSIFIFFTAIYVNAALLEWTVRCRWIILSFCYQGFSKDKVYIMLHGVCESWVKYENATAHAVLLGVISGKCFPLTVFYNG